MKLKTSGTLIQGWDLNSMIQTVLNTSYKGVIYKDMPSVMKMTIKSLFQAYFQIIIFLMNETVTLMWIFISRNKSEETLLIRSDENY